MAGSIHAANDHVLRLMNQLELPEVYRDQPGILHTSSDGQKFEVGVDSLNANYSFKYFGQGKGVTRTTSSTSGISCSTPPSSDPPNGKPPTSSTA